MVYGIEPHLLLLDVSKWHTVISFWRAWVNLCVSHIKENEMMELSFRVNLGEFQGDTGPQLEGMLCGRFRSISTDISKHREGWPVSHISNGFPVISVDPWTRGAWERHGFRKCWWSLTRAGMVGRFSTDYHCRMEGPGLVDKTGQAFVGMGL